MDLCIIRIIILLASSVWGVYSLAITNFTVPDFVKNGTEGSVLLDCEYTFQEEDKKLVVKWFHNDDTTALFQRIKQNKPRRVSDKFGDRLTTDDDDDDDFDDEAKSHLPLLLTKPTIEMSGTYSCEVTSTETMVSRKDEMIIYAIPSSVSMNVSSVGDTLLVMCIVEGVFPMPDIEMFHTEPGQLDSDPVTNVSLNFVKDDDAYDVVLSTNLSEPELKENRGLHFFECEVSIPGTPYKKEAKIPYYPLSHGHRPGIRRKIHSEDGMLHSNDAEELHLDIINYIGEVAANDPQKEQRMDDDDDDDDDGDGAFDIRPSAVIVLILASTLLVLCW